MRHSIRLLFAASVVTALAACGGGSNDPTLSGTAAVGDPIVGGSVSVVCAAGSAISPVLTGTDGTWQVGMSGQTLPCAVKVSGGTVGGTVQSGVYHSIAVSSFVVNITPLTDLIVANLTGSDPATWFTGLNANAIKAVTQGDLTSAIGRVSTALGLTTALGSDNPIATPFEAVTGNKLDNILQALATAGASHQSLVTLAQAQSFVAPNGFNFANAYAALSSGGSGGTGGGTSGTCATGETATTYAASASGGTYTNGQQVCFTATTSTLAFSGKTLTNPTPNAAVQSPFSAYSFVDGDNTYEVVFNAGNLHEINLLVGGAFKGQFAPSSSTGSGGTGTGGTGTGTAGNANLTLQVNVNGILSSTITVGNVPKPASETDFCGAVQSDPNLTQIGTGAGGTLTINSCSYSGNTGTISATVSLTSPIAMSIPYTVIYTYN